MTPVSSHLHDLYTALPVSSHLYDPYTVTPVSIHLHISTVPPVSSHLHDIYTALPVSSYLHDQSMFSTLSPVISMIFTLHYQSPVISIISPCSLHYHQSMFSTLSLVITMIFTLWHQSPVISMIFTLHYQSPCHLHIYTVTPVSSHLHDLYTALPVSSHIHQSILSTQSPVISTSLHCLTCLQSSTCYPHCHQSFPCFSTVSKAYSHSISSQCYQITLIITISTVSSVTAML